MVSDAVVNEWLSPMSLSTKEHLCKLPPDVRQKVAISVYMRQQSHGVQNPEAYLNGAIRKEREGNNFGPSAASSDKPQMPRGPYGAAGSSQQPGQFSVGFVQARPPASPQQAPPPRPAWVLQAWELHVRQKEFFRFLSRHLPAEAFTILGELPGAIQYNMLITLLLSDRAHHEPLVFLKWMVCQYKSLPMHVSSPGSIASAESDPMSKRKIIVLSFGLSAALEWPAIDLGVQFANEGLTDTFEIVRKYSFVSQCVWKEVLDDFFSSVNGVKVEPVCLEESVSFINSNALAWKASGATILALIHVPKPEASDVPALSAAPSFHGRNSGAVWHTFAALRSLEKFVHSICVAAFLPPSVGVADASFFDVLFGSFNLVPAVSFQLPQQPWQARCVPRHLSARQMKRPIVQPTMPLEDFNVSLRGAFQETATTPSYLPPLSLLEELFDADDPAAARAEAKAAGELVRLGAAPDASAPLMLLPRGHLAAVCGLADWKVCQFWGARMPCSKYVNSITGQAAAAGGRESVPCGMARWCPPCTYFYEALNDCPSPYLISNTVMAILQALVADSVPPMSVRRFPEHRCSESCAGFSFTG